MALEPIIYIIDDDADLCQALCWLFDSVKLKVETFSNGRKFLEAYDSSWYGCLLIDVRMPEISGLELQDRLNAKKNKIPIIILTGHGDTPMAVRAMKAGAFDFILKPVDSQYLLDQVQKVLFNEKLRQQATLQQESWMKRLSSLSPREHQILELIVAGKLNKTIAYECNISISTVELYRSRIKQKMQVKSLAELIKSYLTINP